MCLSDALVFPNWSLGAAPEECDTQVDVSNTPEHPKMAWNTLCEQLSGALNVCSLSTKYGTEKSCYRKIVLQKGFVESGIRLSAH